MKAENKLDNPVWHSLSEMHQRFSIDYKNIKFYHPDYCPFGGADTTEGISKPIDEYSLMVDNFFVVGEKPGLSEQLNLKELICLQMIIKEKIDVDIKQNITALTHENLETLFQLVNTVQPGYFKTKTGLLGNYFGIFKSGELVSVSGERMKMNDFVEVSAIVTHPGHTGQGFARQLVAYAANNILNENRIPFLHVLESNTRAIALYEKLGFTTRRKISFWNITR